MPLVKSEYACPRCKRETGASSQIYANAGQLVCSQNGIHAWPDASSMFAEYPNGKAIMEFKVTMVPTVQENRTPMTISVHTSVEAALKQKYGDKLNATVGSLLQMMVEGETMILGQGDLERLTARLGKFESSAELFGLIFAQGEQLTEAKQIAENACSDLKAYEGLSIGKVVISLEGFYQQAVENARNANLPLSLYISQNLKTAIEANWF